MEGNLRIHKVRIRNLGRIENLDLIFNKRVSVVRGKAWREILLTLRILCGNELTEEERSLLKEVFFITAEFGSGRRRCQVEIRQNGKSGLPEWKITVSEEEPDEEKEAERNVRLFLRDIPERRRLRTLYDAKEQGIMERFSEYEAEEPEQREELFKETGGLSATSIFRDLLMERGNLCILEEKIIGGEENQEIREFLKLNRFWNVLDQERGIDRGVGPLIITDQLERIEGEGLQNYLKELRKLYEGQLIVIARKSCL